MTRKKIKLAWIENANARATSMRKMRLGLLKKVREITVLCDLKGCILIFSPNDEEPMVWPSVEATRELLDHFFSLPEVEKVKRETTLESYMKQKTAKMHAEVVKLQKKNKEYGIDLLMDQMNRNRETANLTLSEIYTLLSFLKEEIILCRKKLGPALFPPLRSPPMVPFGLQFEEFRTRTRTTYDVLVGGHESARNDELAGERLNIGTAIMGDQGQYVLDQWVPIHSEPENHQHIGMNQVCYNEYTDFKSYLPFQGSNSNGNPNLEMEPVFPQLMMTFCDLGGSVSQSFQHLGMNSPIEAMSQPMQYSFNPTSHEYNGYGVNEEVYNINNGGSECYRSNNAIAFNDGTGQLPPSNGTTAAGEGNVNVKPIDINRPPGF